MNIIQALVMNMRTCRPDVKREAQVEPPRVESIGAGHRDGSVRSSDEVSVMEMDRRADMSKIGCWSTSDGRN